MFGRNILFYLRETPLGGEETVVSHVIVHCRDFAYQTMVVLGPESMVAEIFLPVVPLQSLISKAVA